MMNSTPRMPPTWIFAAEFMVIARIERVIPNAPVLSGGLSSRESTDLLD